MKIHTCQVEKISTFDDSHSKFTNARFSAAGEYTLRLTADDSQLQGHDDVTITVTDAPTIVLQSPVGGEKWRARTVQTIRWISISVQDVLFS